jgi:ribosomal-protein-alanine N-acetyltransferase
MTDAIRMAIEVRDARSEDAEAIARVARASWTDTYGNIFEPDFIEEFLARNYAVERLREATREAKQRDEIFLVAERGDTVVAYLHFGAGSRGPHLFRIYADPIAYRSGVGSVLLDELHRRLDDRGVGSYELEVHERNERGRAFYDRKGFVIVDVPTTSPGCELTLRRTLHPPIPSMPAVTDRLVLRPLTADDTKALHRIYGDAETMAHIGRTRRPTADLEATGRVVAWAQRHAELHGFSMWAVDERDGEPVVGVAGLIWVDGHGPDVEAAYLVRRDRWGRGYATESLREALRIGHGELGLERIVALAYPENVASRRVMEKSGMRADGTVIAYGHEMTRHVSGQVPGNASS